MIHFERKIQIRSKSLILYDLPDYFDCHRSYNSDQRRLQVRETQKTAYSGTLTPGSKKRLSKAIDIMVQTTKPRRIYSEVAMKEITHRLSFITLTISQTENITAREGYDKGMKHFLQWLRRTMKVTTYVWKCEVQKRGQIHYHITTPSYIHYQKIRDKWNNLQRHNGWLDRYHDTKGHYDANSTDIKEVRKISNLSGYLIKEFCKSIQNMEGLKKAKSDLREILPTLIIEKDYKQYLKMLKDSSILYKVWDCSLNLKKWKYYTIEETDDKTRIMDEMIMSSRVVAIPLENCIVLRSNTASPTEVMNLQQMQGYEEFLTMIRNYRKEEGKKKLVCSK